MKKNNIKIKIVFDIFDNIDSCKQSLKIFIMYTLKSPYLLEYRKNIIVANELLEVLDLTQYLIASNSKFNKKFCKFTNNVITSAIKLFENTKFNNKYDLSITKNLIKALHKTNEVISKFI